MTKNRNLITRHSFVTVDGYPYNVDASFSTWAQQIRPQDMGRLNSVDPPPGENWFQAKSLHETFDNLSKVVPSSRRPDDLVHHQILKDLSSVLETCSPIRTMTHKLIAHNASPFSKSLASPIDLKISLDAIERANEALCTVAAFLYGRILQVGGVVGVPMSLVSHLEFLTEPLITPEQQKELRNWWSKRTEKVNVWTSADDSLEQRLQKLAHPKFETSPEVP
jgi:hypothetical protein